MFSALFADDCDVFVDAVEAIGTQKQEKKTLFLLFYVIVFVHFSAGAISKQPLLKSTPFNERIRIAMSSNVCFVCLTF